jgi:hypothetical protein
MVRGFPLLFDSNWLKSKITADPDLECEVGTLTKSVPDGLRQNKRATRVCADSVLRSPSMKEDER